MTFKFTVSYQKGAFISMLLASLVYVSIWFPEIAHWHVSPMPTTVATIDIARKSPEQSILDEVAAMHLSALVLTPKQILPIAEQVMHGNLILPGFPPAPIKLPFSPDDLQYGSSTFQLMIASLASADVLLDAYRMTRREDLFRQARDIIVGFARFEAEQWVDHGLMWNDHAVAARIPVLVKFWAEYRSHSEFDPQVGRIVLHLVARSAQLLAKPSFYAWRTSHGILSDLAILQVAVAFPDLPDIAELRSIAVERFRDHLIYWINEEGITLLHSAGYHSGSLYHFGLALRLYTLNGIKIPDEWWQRYARAVEFNSLLRRPDGTLPMYGDTSSIPNDAGTILTAKRESDGGAQPLSKRMLPPRTSDVFALFPVAGHSIWWDGFPKAAEANTIAAQTMITWSYHPGHGHKVADELSMILWASGRTWVTNTGYWPYGLWGREQSESWGATNAPHSLGESKDSERSSRVRAFGQGEGIVFIDIERSGSVGFAVRRQIARLIDDNSWFVLDHSRNSAAQTTTTTNWTFYPDLSVTQLATEGLYWISPPDSTAGMLSSFTGSEGFRSELTAGRQEPFAGWVVLDRTPTRAPAIVISQSSPDNWGLASFSLVDKCTAATSNQGARMVNWINADHWTVVAITTAGEITLTRTASRLVVHRNGLPGIDAGIDLEVPQSPVAGITVIREAFHSASENYRKFPELISYRVRVSQLLLALLAGQELLLFLTRRRLARFAATLRITSWICWSSGGLWLSQAYFAAPS